MVTIFISGTVTFLDWDTAEEVKEFMNDNHNTVPDLVHESDYQSLFIKEIKEEK